MKITQKMAMKIPMLRLVTQYCITSPAAQSSNANVTDPGKRGQNSPQLVTGLVAWDEVIGCNLQLNQYSQPVAKPSAGSTNRAAYAAKEPVVGINVAISPRLTMTE